MPRLVVLGGGGHASDVISVVESLGLASVETPVVVVDTGSPDLGRFADRNVRVVGSFDAARELVGPDAQFVSGVGYPTPRRSLVEQAAGQGWAAVAALIHETSVCNANSHVGDGAVVMGQTWISPAVGVGRHVYVGYGANLGHDAVIGEFTSLLPGCFIGGNVVVEAMCLVGANATILPRVRLGTGCQVGAGAVVTSDVAPGVTVAGVPAKVLGS